MRQSACLVSKPFALGCFASVFNCAPVDQSQTLMYKMKAVQPCSVVCVCSVFSVILYGFKGISSSVVAYCFCESSFWFHQSVYHNIFVCKKEGNLFEDWHMNFANID